MVAAVAGGHVPWRRVEAGLTNDVSGDFEVHITAYERDAGKLADFAEGHGLKYTHVLLDRG